MTFPNFNISFQPHPTNSQFKDLTGRVFHRWTVLGYAGKKRRVHQWVCQCECSTVKTVRVDNLTGGRSQSCGCWKSEFARRQFTRHGECTKVASRYKVSGEYNSYIVAKGRCNNPRNKAFHNYGGRGIEFRFDSFTEFLDSVGRRPTPKHSLNRVNNDGHYEKGNVEWATATAQANNRRTSHYLTANGQTLTISEWSRQVGLKAPTILRRIRTGWCEHCAIHNVLRHMCPHILKTD